MSAPASHPGTAPRWRGLLLLAGLGLFAVFLALPAPAGLSPAGWHAAAVALLMALWWITEALPLAVTSLLPLVLFPALGILPSRQIAHEYANHLVFLFLGGFFIAIAMERWGLHRRLALGLVTRVGTQPRRLVLGFLLASAFLSAWVSNTATTLMLLPIAMAVVSTLANHAASDGCEGGEDGGANREDLRTTLGPILMLALAWGAGVGGIATLVGTPPNIVLAGQVHELFPDLAEIGFGRWMLLGVPISITMLVVAYFVLIYWGARGRLGPSGQAIGGREVLLEQRQALGRTGEGERKVLGIFLVTVLLWLTRQSLQLGFVRIPGWSGLLPQPGFVHDATVAIAASITLFALRAERPDSGAREPLLDWESARAHTPWGILLLFGGGFALAAGFRASGLADWIGNQLVGLRGVPIPVVMMFTSIVAMGLTEVTSNTATSTLLMPILAAISTSLEAPPLLLMIPAALSASCAFMLPVATPPNAIVFGSGWISIREMARVGVVLNLIGVVVITGFVWWLAPLVFGVEGAGG